MTRAVLKSDHGVVYLISRITGIFPSYTSSTLRDTAYDQQVASKKTIRDLEVVDIIYFMNGK